MTRRVPDESEIRTRPSKHGSRPRSKQRPAHAEAVRGFVTAVDRGRYTLLIADRAVTAMKARELSRTRVVCGDRVDVVGDVSGSPGTLARIVRIAERTSILRRTADDDDPYERIVVANADQLVIVTALSRPEPRTGMIDRCVVAAYDAGMDVLLCLTKADLADPEPLRALYEPIGVKVLVTRLVEDPTAEAGAEATDGDAADGTDGPEAEEAGADHAASADMSRIEPIGPVRDALRGRLSVLVGHSGVGKSTLVNALVPDADRSTGLVNDVTGRGRHTSTSAVALRLPEDGTLDNGKGDPGWVIDTPGIRSFGLAHVRIANVLRAFQDLAEVAAACPRGCTHLADSPDCALDDWIAAGADEAAARAARVESFRRLWTARTAGSVA